jgi:hypothetical protein
MLKTVERSMYDIKYNFLTRVIRMYLCEKLQCNLLCAMPVCAVPLSECSNLMASVDNTQIYCCMVGYNIT